MDTHVPAPTLPGHLLNMSDASLVQMETPLLWLLFDCRSFAGHVFTARDASCFWRWAIASGVQSSTSPIWLVIPEGSGPVKPLLGVVIVLFGFSGRFWARRAKASGSKIGPWADRVAAGGP